jgi:hypothetical protein
MAIGFRITHILFAVAAMSMAALLPARGAVNVTTYHNDNARTGWNPSETTLNQSSFSSFGLLETVTLDDQVDAEPLLVNGETINGSQHNVLYVATESNSVYAIDAQSGQILLQTNLGAPVPYYDLPGGCNNNGPNVGIDSTPVIDATAGLLYVIAFTWENNAAVYRIHALSLITLSDSVTPVVISASAKLTDGSTYEFNAGVNRQRPALLLSNSTIYAGFGSFCDIAANESRGWVLGWKAGSLTPLIHNKLNNRLASSQDDFFLSSVWMSGFGLAADASGDVFFVTGNSDYSGNSYNKTSNISESAVELTSDLSTVKGLYTPQNEVQLEQEDGDFGSGGLMVIPQGNGPGLAVAAGKDGTMYLFNAPGLKLIPVLGQLPVQCEISKCNTQLPGYQIGGCWCGPSYYQGSDGIGRIVSSGNTTLGVWQLRLPLALQDTWCCVADGQNSGFFTSVSSNGTTAGSAVIWAVGRPTDSDPAYIDLYAIDPDNGQMLFSETAGAWPNMGGDSNIAPMIVNGLVYVASNQMLTIFGPGGDRHAKLPPVAHVDMQLPLPAGEHQIYGTVEAMTGAFVTIRTRKGDVLRIDTTDARRASRYAQPSPGRALLARGTFAARGNLFLADVVLHAVKHPAMWPPDR